MNQISTNKIIYDFKSINWENYITGIFKSDKWHLPSMFENYPNSKIRKNIYFDYIENYYFKSELKYYLMYKLEKREYTPTNVAKHLCYTSKNLWCFIKENNLCISSILELDYNKTLLLLRTWIAKKGFSENNPLSILFKGLYKFYLRWYDKRDEYDKEIWDLRNFYPKNELPKYLGNRAWYIDFSYIQSNKFRNVLKNFYKMRVAIRCLQTVSKEFHYLKHFIIFIQEKYPHIDSFSMLERYHIEEFCVWLACQKNRFGKFNSMREKRFTLQYLRLVFEYLQKTGNSEAPKQFLIYQEDKCGVIKKNPHFIPEIIFIKLKGNLHLLPPNMKNAIIIIMNVGMRVSELLTLKEDCLSYDKDNFPWIKYFIHKMNKEHCVPINQEVVEVIKSQIAIAKKIMDYQDEKYIFRNYKGLLQYQTLASNLKKLSENIPLEDSFGNIYYINLHQFRHTVGTRMINANIPITSVQKYLGHESPEMTMVYAHIHDKTLKEDFEKVIKNKLFDYSDTIDDAKTSKLESEMDWFKHNLYKNALPNGYCLRHPKQGSCPHANVCLTCPKFTTSKSFYPVLKQQFETTEILVNDARERGWDREFEHQSNILLQLKKILDNIKNT